jgi:hypothetical protein
MHGDIAAALGGFRHRAIRGWRERRLRRGNELRARLLLRGSGQTRIRRCLRPGRRCRQHHDGHRGLPGAFHFAEFLLSVPKGAATCETGPVAAAFPVAAAAQCALCRAPSPRVAAVRRRTANGDGARKRRFDLSYDCTPGPLNFRSPKFKGSTRAALRLQQIDAVAVTGKQLDRAVRQGLGRCLLLRRRGAPRSLQ